MSEDKDTSEETELDFEVARDLLNKTTSANLAAMITNVFDFPMPKKWSKSERLEAILNHCEEDEEAQGFLLEIMEELQTKAAPASTNGKGAVRPIPTRGAGHIICTRILGYVEEGEDIDEDVILEAVLDEYPNQNPGPSAIAYYKTLLRNNGHEIPGGRGKKATEPVANEQEGDAAAV